jgi:hypothetical protein
MSTGTVTAAKITYRKTRQGKWVAYGPAAAMPAPGALAEIAKRGGGRDFAYIAYIGRPFTVDGTEMVYGYIDAARPVSRYDAQDNQRAASGSRCGTCRCHAEAGAGQPGTILYDGCDRCGCESA